MPTEFKPEFVKEVSKERSKELTFDDEAQSNFIKGAKIAYENIITSFSLGNLSSVKNEIQLEKNQIKIVKDEYCMTYFDQSLDQ